MRRTEPIVFARVMACGIQFPDQGSNLGLLHGERRVLATGPPGKSLEPLLNYQEGFPPSLGSLGSTGLGAVNCLQQMQVHSRAHVSSFSIYTNNSFVACTLLQHNVNFATFERMLL